MSKTVWRFFGGFLQAQQDFLNKMAQQGWRLAKTGKFRYTFEPCEAGKYEYAVEFTGEKSLRAIRDYQMFLEEMGYRTFTKSINLNFSFGKVRWRPWAKGAGQLATSPGGFGKELLILEKERDGTPFQLHTDPADIAAYLAVMRNMYLTLFLLCLMGAVLALRGGSFSVTAAVFLGLTLLAAVPTLRYNRLVRRAEKEARF